MDCNLYIAWFGCISFDCAKFKLRAHAREEDSFVRHIVPLSEHVLPFVKMVFYVETC